MTASPPLPPFHAKRRTVHVHFVIISHAQLLMGYRHLSNTAFCKYKSNHFGNSCRKNAKKLILPSLLRRIKTSFGNRNVIIYSYMLGRRFRFELLVGDILGQDCLLSQCLSPPRCTNGYIKLLRHRDRML